MGTPDWVETRKRVKRFVEDNVYPAEDLLDNGTPEAARAELARLMAEAKAEGLWALGHPKEIGGQGMPFMDYVYVNEVIGRSQYAMVALGTHSLQDSIMLNLYAAPEWRDRYLKPLVAKWWLPDAVVFVDSLPHTATGKLLKTALRETFRDYRFAA